jgi:adenylate cyclase class 2
MVNHTNMEYQELELKYNVFDLARIEKRLTTLGALCDQPRTLEINLRFDAPDYSLTLAGKALRLRYDTKARLTYKGPSQSQEGIRLREEIEFVVDNFQAAQAFLIALGYQVSLVYEKYRSGYILGDVHILLDELPYGNFVEIEGPDPAKIRAVNEQLGLNWETRISESYTVLFERLRKNLGLSFRDLIFENFQGLQVTTANLEIQPADE